MVEMEKVAKTAKAKKVTNPTADRVDMALSHFFAAQPPNGRHICIAFSGGMDSVVLLHALSRHQRAWRGAEGDAPFVLSAVHVHHGLSPRADGWADFCAEVCGRLGVALDVVRVDVPRDSGEGLEAAARRCRYRVFSEVDADWLVLAHHRDDQAETVLLNLLRGAGVAGVAGMPAMRAQGGRGAPCAWLVRPLLGVPRAAIEVYAAEHGLRWVDDESNGDRHFRRNFLRHEVLPALEDRFPGASRALARAAGHFAEAAHLLDQLAALDADAARLPSGRIGLAAFNGLPPERARNLLRHVWADAGFRMPEARWLEEVRRQLATADAESETCVATPDGELRIYRGELYCLPHRRPLPRSPVVWRGETELPWSAGKVRFEESIGVGIARHWLVGGSANGDVGRLMPMAVQADSRVELRTRQGGERFRPQAGRPRRALRNLLQEAAVPPWERAQMPLLWIGDRLVWVGGLGVDAGFACAPGEPGLMPVWLP